MSRRQVGADRQPVFHSRPLALAESQVSEPPPAPTPQQLAFRIVIELYRATSGRAMEHKRINRVAAAAGIVHAAERAAAVQHAVALGLLDLHDGHSICLTDEGRRLLR